MEMKMTSHKKAVTITASSGRLFLFGVMLSLVGFTLNFHTFQHLLSPPSDSDSVAMPYPPRRALYRSQVKERRRNSNSVGGKKQPLRAAAPKGESVALLISGQCHRFIYREQSGPLFHTSSTNPGHASSSMGNATTATATTAPTPYTLDVYITLQCGDGQNSLVGRVDTPPYMETLNVTDIEAWYKMRGAHRVTVKVLDPATMQYAYDETTHQATTVYKNNYGHKLSYMLGWPRWMIEVRKFYARHVVFSLAQDVQDEYSTYVFWREDNYFFTPIDLDDVFFGKHKPRDEPYVIVDQHCEFHAYSDKMYIANHLGAALLFSSTKAEFFSWMKRFALFGFYRMHWHGDPLQPETFVHETLLKVNVEKVDLRRVDVRYVNSVRCVPALYYYCMPESTKSLATQHGLVVCPQTGGETLAQQGSGGSSEIKEAKNSTDEPAAKQDNAAPMATG